MLYSVPYNPASNPIEMIFSPLKAYIKSNDTRSLIAIERSIDDYIGTVSEFTLKKMFTKAFLNLVKI